MWRHNLVNKHILPNISWSKSNQTIKLGQVTEHNNSNIFLLNSCKKSGSETSSRPLFVFRKALYDVKASDLQSGFQYISIVLNFGYNKNKLWKNLDLWSRDMINLDFLEKGLGIVSPRHFVNDFARKMLDMLSSINWRDFLAWLCLLLEIFVLQLFVNKVVTW